MRNITIRYSLESTLLLYLKMRLQGHCIWNSTYEKTFWTFYHEKDGLVRLMTSPFFLFRNSDRGLYGGDGFEYQENSEYDRNIRDCGRGINSECRPLDKCFGREISNGQSQTDTSEVRQNYIRRLQESKEGSGPLTQRLFPFRTNNIAYYGDQKL